MEEDETDKRRQSQSQEIVRALEALKRASKEVELTASNSPSLRALLELETRSDDLFSDDPLLTPLRHLLTELRYLSVSLPLSPSPQNRSGISLLNRIFRRPESEQHAMVSRIAGSIAREIQSWIDRKTLDRIVYTMKYEFSDEERIGLLISLESRAGEGFDRGFQSTLLKSGAFSIIESSLADPSISKPVRDRCAELILALVRFNKDVFVGPILMGPTIGSLVSLASPSSLRALNGLITAIRSPLIDELHSRGELQKLVSLLSSPDLEVRILALDFALRIGYFARKEAIEAMICEGLIKRLLFLQRSDLGGAMIEMDGWDLSHLENGKSTKNNSWIYASNFWKQDQGASREMKILELRPFASSVARFAVQVEVGEGLRQREKREAKQEILKRVKETADSQVELANVLAEVLWGSSP